MFTSWPCRGADPSDSTRKQEKNLPNRILTYPTTQSGGIVLRNFAFGLKKNSSRKLAGGAVEEKLAKLEAEFECQLNAARTSTAQERVADADIGGGAELVTAPVARRRADFARSSAV